MCVDAKVNLAPRKYYCESQCIGCDVYFQVFLEKNRPRPTETVLRPNPSLNVDGQWLLWHVALVWSGLLMR